MKVLIVKTSSMGDIIHTLPALTDAAKIFPGILFDWVIDESFFEIPSWHPAVNRIFSVTTKKLKFNWNKLSLWKQHYDVVKRLRQNKYDIVIDAQGLFKTSILITGMVSGRYKHGMDFLSIREFMGSFLYQKRYYISKKKHAIERIRRLFAYSLEYLVPNSIGDYGIYQFFKFKEKDYNNNYHHNYYPYVVFIYATTKKEKYWPKKNWYEIAHYIIDSGYYIKLFCHTKKEYLNFCSFFCFYKKRIKILMNFKLFQIAEQLFWSSAVLSIDTGLSHLSAALGCLNLTLYGPTDPKLIGVYGANQTILRSSTRKMENLSVEYVWNVFQEILKDKK